LWDVVEEEDSLLVTYGCISNQLFSVIKEQDRQIDEKKLKKNEHHCCLFIFQGGLFCFYEKAWLLGLRSARACRALLLRTETHLSA